VEALPLGCELLLQRWQEQCQEQVRFWQSHDPFSHLAAGSDGSMLKSMLPRHETCSGSSTTAGSASAFSAHVRRRFFKEVDECVDSSVLSALMVGKGLVRCAIMLALMVEEIWRPWHTLDGASCSVGVQRARCIAKSGLVVGERRRVSHSFGAESFMAMCPGLGDTA
jgi:hypothetical protein